MENTGQKHRPHIKVGKDVDEEEEEEIREESIFRDNGSGVVKYFQLKL